MSRSKTFLSGAALAYLYQGSMMVVGLWLTPFYLRHLGAHDYGIWLVGLQVLNFLLLCDLGVLAVIPRDIAQAHGRELAQSDTAAMRLLIGRLLKTVLVQSALVAVVAGGVYFFRPVAATGLRGPVALVLLVFVVTFPLRAAGVVLQGLQDLKFLGLLRMWMWGFAAALIVAMLMAGAGFYALASGWCLQEAGGSLIAVYRLRRLRPDLLNITAWREAGPFRWEWLARGLWISLGQASNALVGGTDLLIIARVFGPATVVIYSCTGKLVQVLQQQPQVLASTAMPGLSQMKTSEGRDRIRKATTCLTQAMIFVAGAIVCVVLPLNQQFINHWIGARYFGGVTLTALFLANFLVRLIDYTLAIALFAFGHEKLYAMRSLADGVFSVALASILARPLGLNGVILGFLCGALLVAIPMDLHRFGKEFGVSILEAVRPYAAYLWRIAAVGAAAFLILRRVNLPNLFSLAVAGILVGLLYLLVTLPYLRTSELGEYVLLAMPDVRFLRILRSKWSKGAGNAPGPLENNPVENNPVEPEAVTVPEQR
jgi:O-antigen/teichoic acid export membrane protein